MEFPPPPPPERSKRLHNFTLPYLRWGQQRFLRCVKLSHHRSPSSFPSSSSSPSPDRAALRSPSVAGGGVVISGGEFAPGDGNLRLDLKVSVLGNEAKNGDAVAAAAARPWNLRTRRAACNEPGDEPARIVESSSLRRHEIGVKRGCEVVGDGDGDSQKNAKVKFSVPLLREEIEEDFTALIGKRPPRRPKKRPRMVQKQMNTLFPGLWLAEEVTAESYDVPEAAET
ncbi:unnamed protein product [Microthlaspi erraticum]|uniref:DUF1639 domain-containing protein n=1 Tax=Microthlaspi erraticum TaxID=1685480 RepID=A0A6D2KVA7_9BRAS|nr:unnamed protein product [Microthlaspi erraticum]